MLRMIDLGLAVLLLASSCSGPAGPALYPVSGKVSFKEKPLSTGRIVFVPDRNQPDSGPVHATEIVAGAYSANVSAGKKTVQIHASFPTGKTGTREDGSKFPEMEGLPERYNSASTLEITIEPRPNENVDFDLK